VLLDDPDALPAAWRARVEKIGYRVDPGVALIARARAGTDLHTLQATLLESRAGRGGTGGTKSAMAKAGAAASAGAGSTGATGSSPAGSTPNAPKAASLDSHATPGASLDSHTTPGKRARVAARASAAGQASLAFDEDTGVGGSAHQNPTISREHTHAADRAPSTAADASSAKVPLNGDHSVLLIRSASRDLSARAIAEWALAIDDPMGTVVVAETDGIIVDNAFERTGMPRAGFQHYTRFRAVGQVLKLGLSLLWQPLNPHLLMQFLIHPVSPLSGPARRTLSEAVAEQPGTGGRAWTNAIESVVQFARARPQATDHDVQKLRADIDYWCTAPRFEHTGAPLAALAERAQRVANWLNARLAN
jgi:hypothetical protein